MKKIFLLLSLLFCLSLSYAQSSPVEHIVERGETIASIAKMYNVTPDAILEANPSAKEMVFSGMVLTIPQAKANPSSVSENNTDAENRFSIEGKSRTGNDQNSNPIIYAQNENSDIKSDNDVTEKVGIERFTCYSLNYLASFKDFEHGYYGLYWQVFSESGWGGTFSMNGNWGLGDGNIMFKFGPIYGYAITDYLALNASLRGIIQTYDKYDKYTGKRKGTSVTGGITVTPSINFRVGRLILGFGYEMGWGYKVKGLCHNAQFVIGIDL